MTSEEATVAEGNPDIRRIAEKFAPEVVYLHVVDLETRVARLEEALREIAEYPKDNHPMERAGGMRRVARAALASGEGT